MALSFRPGGTVGVEPLLPVRSSEQIPEGPPHPIGHPSPAPVFLFVVQDVTPLAERREVSRMVVHRIVVEMRGREDNARLSGRRSSVRSLQARHGPSPAVPPGVPLFIPPSAVSEVLNRLAVGPVAMFAPALRTPKPDRGRQLAPVDRVEPAMLLADRHGASREPLMDRITSQT